MNRYAGKDYSDKNYSDKKEPSKFLTRFSAVTEAKESLKTLNIKDEFNKGYKAGKVVFASAQKYMSLINCGLDHFIEANTDVVWTKEGDNIVRVDNDLNWVNQFLEQEGTR